MNYTCKKCGTQFSDKVYKIHAGRCNAVGNPDDNLDPNAVINMDNPNMYKEMTFNELRQAAKGIELGLDSTPKKAELIDALEINHFGCVQPVIEV